MLLMGREACVRVCEYLQEHKKKGGKKGLIYKYLGSVWQHGEVYGDVNSEIKIISNLQKYLLSSNWHIHNLYEFIESRVNRIK